MTDWSDPGPLKTGSKP